MFSVNCVVVKYDENTTEMFDSRIMAEKYLLKRNKYKKIDDWTFKEIETGKEIQIARCNVLY